MNARGLTLIELLLAISLYALILMIVVPCVRGGLLFWERAGSSAQQMHDIDIFFTKLGLELANAVPFLPVPFKGSDTELEMIAASEDPFHSQGRQLARIRYWLEGPKLYREQSNLAKLLHQPDAYDESHRETRWIENLSNFTFEYAFAGEKGETIWKREWKQSKDKREKDELPLGIKVSMGFRDAKGRESSYEKIYYLPDGVRRTVQNAA